METGHSETGENIFLVNSQAFISHQIRRFFDHTILNYGSKTALFFQASKYEYLTLRVTLIITFHLPFEIRDTNYPLLNTKRNIHLLE